MLKYYMGDDTMHILKIEEITVSIEEKIILKDFSLVIKSGEIHAIMGPNGTGKSTLTRVIMGDNKYKIEKGKIYFDNKDITGMTTDERARLGIFLAFQLPNPIEGVTNADFLRTAKHETEKEKFKMLSFIKELNTTCEKLKMNKDMIYRSINLGFSGGERKKNEILQMWLLKPNTVFLDEIDSGLDVDSLKIIGESVMEYFNEYKPSILLVTHYERLLEYIKPDFVHIMMDGHIIKTGDLSLVKEIEEKGYDFFKNEYSNILEK